MSTRSGKLLHGSLHEIVVETDVAAPRSERKKRNKLLKENIENPNMVLHKFKKRENYVSYPTDDEQVGDTANLDGNEGRNTRTLRKTALKELNPAIILTENTDCKLSQKTVRSTRRTRKFAEMTTGAEDVIQGESEVEEKKPKKSKRKNVSSGTAEPQKLSKKKNKKKSKRSNSFISANVSEEVIVENDVVNNSNISNDSFHSAAGSPVHEHIKAQEIEDTEAISVILPKRYSKKTKKAQVKYEVDHLTSKEQAISVNQNKATEREKSRRKSSINVGIDETDNNTNSKANISFSKEESHKNGVFDIESIINKKKSSIINTDHNDIVTKVKNSDENITSYKGDYKNNETFYTEQDSSNKKPSNVKYVFHDESVTKIRKTYRYTSLSKDDYKGNYTFDVDENKSIKKKSSINNASLDASITKLRKLDVTDAITKDNETKNNTFDVDEKIRNNSESIEKINTTFEKENSSASKSRKRKLTMDNMDINMVKSKEIPINKIPSLNSTYDKVDTSAKVNTTFEVDNLSSPSEIKRSPIDTTFEKETMSPRAKLRKSRHSNRMSKDPVESPMVSLNRTFEASTKAAELDKSDNINTTFDKPENMNTTFDKLSRSSLISSDTNNEEVSRISITSDESIREDKIEPTKKPVTIMNVTPVLIDSSIDDSIISEKPKTQTPLKREGTFSVEEKTTDNVPLKREGTFTKDGPDDPCVKVSPVTPTKNVSLASPGCTPFLKKTSGKEPLLNVTRSIEKRKSTLDAPRITRVMFCSPVNNPIVVAQQKKTVIKSNLKGSNKSFVYEEIADSPLVRPSGRKRSYTHSEVDDSTVKRKRLTDDIRQSVDRLSRPRTSSANAKLTETTPSKKSTTPSKAKVARTKLPNFAAMHQKQFDKMESLDECQERKAKRARQLLTPIQGVNLPDKSSPKVTDSPKELPKKEIKKPENLMRSFSQEASKPAYTRFGFKLNLDVNPFSIPSKNVTKKDKSNGMKRQATLPSLTGATSVRREMAKQVVMREKSFTDKRSLKRNENRTIIKGVRTNRRFELQMKLRNIE